MKANARYDKLAPRGFIAGSPRFEIDRINSVPPATASVLFTVRDGLNRGAASIHSVADRPHSTLPTLVFAADAPLSAAARIQSVTDRIHSETDTIRSTTHGIQSVSQGIPPHDGRCAFGTGQGSLRPGKDPLQGGQDRLRQECTPVAHRRTPVQDRQASLRDGPALVRYGSLSLQPAFAAASLAFGIRGLSAQANRAHTREHA